MYGRIKIDVREIDNEASAVEIHTKLDNGSPEEAINVVHGLSDAFHLLENPDYAGTLALCMLTNKPVYQLADELGPERAVIMGKALYETTNEVVDEIARRNKDRKNDGWLKRMVDKLFEE